MRVPLALLADYANVSIEGKLNIMGIFDSIWAASVPTIYPQMRLVMKLQSEPAERGQTKTVDIRLLDEDGRIIMSVQASMELPEDSPLVADYPHILELSGLRFERYGNYSFHILVNGETKAQVPFKVAQLPNQAG